MVKFGYYMLSDFTTFERFQPFKNIRKRYIPLFCGLSPKVV
jgi:hypothetical protein